MRGPFWDHVRTILEPGLDNVLTILEPCLDNVCTMLGQWFDNFETMILTSSVQFFVLSILESVWDSFQIIVGQCLKQFLDHFGTVWGPCWVNVGTILVHFGPKPPRHSKW